MTGRALIASAMLLSAIVAPWWLAAIGALLLALRFRAWEVIMLGMLLDMMWLPFEIAHGIPITTCLALILVWAFEPLRRQFLFDYE